MNKRKMKTFWGSTLIYNTHTNGNHDSICGQTMLLTLRAERLDNLFRRSSPHLLQKHLLLSPAYDARRPFPPPKRISKPSRLNKPAFLSDVKPYWIYMNGLQWFHEGIRCIFMQVDVAQGNKLAKTPPSIRGKQNIYAPAIRSFSFLFVKLNPLGFFPWPGDSLNISCVCVSLAPLSLLRFLRDPPSLAPLLHPPPKYHNWRCASNGF